MEGRFEKKGLSFDDVLLIPDRTESEKYDVSVTTFITPQIGLNIPIVSAAMDRVTEARLAIALAREGGIGVIHRNMDPESQAVEVDRVKRSESGMIIDPYTLGPDQTVREALQIMAEYHISGLPVTDTDGKLLGILTNRDLRFETDLDKRVSDAMTREGLVTTGEGTTLEEAKSILHEHRIEKLPVVEEDGRLLGLITIKDIEKVAQFPNACKDAHGRLRVAAAVGVGEDARARGRVLADRGVDLIVVDAAHGHAGSVIDTVKALKGDLPELQVVAGNVATAKGVEALAEAGADGVKVGIGPGSICTTRVVAGAGVPQITAIHDCSAAAAELGVTTIADGGIRYSGDITKAIAAGADCVMIGSLLAGTEESPGETVLYRGRTYKEYRGMGSIAAMRDRASVRDRYGQTHIVEEEELVPEGLEGRVPHKGALSGVVHQLVGGLQSGMGYCGVRNVEELKTKARFIRITSAGMHESHPHDITITEEAPNYRIPDNF
ncbi:MAG: IMP dehydrogenase [Armatimonadota bacterium]|nr:IMP dehydrogenase [Armatimonadota bacterium]